MNSGWSQIYEISSAASSVWGGTGDVEVCEFSGEKSLTLNTINPHSEIFQWSDFEGDWLRTKSWELELMRENNSKFSLLCIK